MIKSFNCVMLSLVLITSSQLWADTAASAGPDIAQFRVILHENEARNMTWGDETCMNFGDSKVGPIQGHRPGGSDDRWSEWADACQYACKQAGYTKKSNAQMHYSASRGHFAYCCCQ